MSHAKPKAYIDYINGLRAFAVIAVLLFHLNNSLIPGGYVGVDVFFVISGFLITRLIIKEITQTGYFNFINFYCRRVKRLFPALFFVLLCTLIAGVVLLAPSNLRFLGRSLAAAALSLSNCLFWLESGYFNTTTTSKPLLHTWSLSVEEQFYLLWPFILFLVAVKWQKRFWPWAIVFLGIVSFSLNLALQKSHLTALYFLMPFRVFEFCIGALMVWLINLRPKSDFPNECLCLLGLGMMLYAVFYFTKDTVFPSYNALLPTIGAALVIYAGGARYSGKLFSNKLAVGLGLISYSLYLVHWPIIVFYSYFTAAEITSFYIQIMVCVSAILVALFTYQFIEKPFRYADTLDKRAQRKLIVQWVPSITVTVCCGFALYMSHGLLWRIPALDGAQFSPEQIALDYHKAHFGGQGFAYPFGWTYKTSSKRPDIVLLGDSHAQMLQYGLAQEIAKPYRKSIYMAGSSCLVLPGLSRTTPGDDWDTICPHVLQQALAQLNKKPDSVLILSEYWIFQILMVHELGNHEAWNIDLTSVKKSDYQPLFTKLAKLRQLIGDHTLIIIGDVPGAGIKDPFACLTRPVISKTQCIDKINTLAQANTKAINVNRVLKSFAKNNRNTYFFDPYRVFCTDTICHSLSTQGEPYYSDDNHLSEAGSAYFISQVKTELLPFFYHQKS
ncbi:MAG: acyltransferase family protein [Legionella sp.]|uniref:acyltransferase family protein n=1 Tax=Legionella sp. TaxID=459 RepID=UPI0039E7182D